VQERRFFGNTNILLSNPTKKSNAANNFPLAVIKKMNIKKIKILIISFSLIFTFCNNQNDKTLTVSNTFDTIQKKENSIEENIWFFGKICG